MVALALALVLVLDGRAPRGASDRALVPGLDVAHVTSLRWERPGRPSVQLVRDAGGWRWTEPFAATADAAAVANVLSALRAARWQRRAGAAAAGTPTTTLTVAGEGGAVLRTLRLGEPVAGAEQQWIIDGARALLVDRWIARVLDPDELALMVTRPFDAADQAAVIEIGGARLEGQPRRRVRPSEVLLDPGVVDELERALTELTIISLAPEPVEPGAAPLAIDLGRVRGTLGGPCGSADCVVLDASTGRGCVTRAAAERVREASAPLTEPTAAAIIDPRPAPLAASSITLAEGAVLDLARAPRIDGQPADPARVAELLAVLGTAIPRAELRAAPATPPAGTITVADARGVTIVLELHAPRLVRRAGEALALGLTPPAWAVLTRPARALRDPSLWVEDPLAISRLAIDGVSYQRGEVVGEWTRSPPGPHEPAAVEALVALLAAPRSLGPAPASFAIRRRVTLLVSPPTGPPVEHVLELGAPTRQGCPARTGGTTGVLPAEVCAAVARLAR